MPLSGRLWSFTQTAFCRAWFVLQCINFPRIAGRRPRWPKFLDEVSLIQLGDHFNAGSALRKLSDEALLEVIDLTDFVSEQKSNAVGDFSRLSTPVENVYEAGVSSPWRSAPCFRFDLSLRCLLIWLWSLSCNWKFSPKLSRFIYFSPFDFLFINLEHPNAHLWNSIWLSEAPFCGKRL